MKRLADLTEDEFTMLKGIGMLWEFYPEAPEKYAEIERGLMADDPNVIGRSAERKFLVKLSDETLQIVEEKELNDWIKTDEEFDGFHAWIMMGELIPADLR